MSEPSLVFASAAGGSAFMEELLEVVAQAVRDVGGQASTHVGPLPDGDSTTVYVMVPHEFLVVTPEKLRPRPDQLKRTIGFCVEHPGTATFETSASLLDQLGAVMDINDDSTAELNRRGHQAHRYVLGYTPRWDAWGGDLDQPREIDVTYLGTAERRRSRLLASAMTGLAGRSVRLLTPPHEPMTRPRPDFLMGQAKFEHLGRTRALINLHREATKALEWVRVLEAMCNGCVVVTEHSADVEPLQPGKHLIVTAPHVIGDVTAALLDDPDYERGVRAEAYRFVREELDMAASASRLVELATDLIDRVPAAAPTGFVQRGLSRSTDSGEAPLAIDTPCFSPEIDPRRTHHVPSNEARVGADLAVARAHAAQNSSNLVYRPATTPLTVRDARRADGVDVLIVRRPSDPSVAGLVDDLALGTVVPRRVMVCVDGGPTTGATHYDELVNPVAAGVGWSRNQLLERSDAASVLVLSADMRCAPSLLEELLNATADIAHCPVGDQSQGMVGALPMEQRRLAVTPYLGAGYLVSRALVDKLGRWSADPWCDGLEDHMFWSAAAATGCSAELVQNVLLWRAQSTVAQSTVALRPVDLDPVRAWQAAQPPTG